MSTARAARPVDAYKGHGGLVATSLGQREPAASAGAAGHALTPGTDVAPDQSSYLPPALQRAELRRRRAAERAAA